MRVMAVCLPVNSFPSLHPRSRKPCLGPPACPIASRDLSGATGCRASSRSRPLRIAWFGIGFDGHLNGMPGISRLNRSLPLNGIADGTFLNTEPALKSAGQKPAIRSRLDAGEDGGQAPRSLLIVGLFVRYRPGPASNCRPPPSGPGVVARSPKTLSPAAATSPVSFPCPDVEEIECDNSTLPLPWGRRNSQRVPGRTQGHGHSTSEYPASCSFSKVFPPVSFSQSAKKNHKKKKKKEKKISSPSMDSVPSGPDRPAPHFDQLTVKATTTQRSRWRKGISGRYGAPAPQAGVGF